MEHLHLDKIREFLHGGEFVIDEGMVNGEAYLLTDHRFLIYSKEGWMYEFYPDQIELQIYDRGEERYLHLIYLGYYDYYFEELGQIAPYLIRLFNTHFS